MDIIHNVHQKKQFEELYQGDVFIDVDDRDFYMKTSEAYEYPNKNCCCFNAVNLVYGNLCTFENQEAVLIPEKAVLTIDD